MKKVLYAGLAIAIIVCVAGCLRMAVVKKKYEKNPPLPVLDGKLRVSGLQGPVDVYRDEYGIPHVFTENEHDLFFAVGYVQAQDRLWWMCLFRGVCQGRMSELFGEVGVPVDLTFEGMPLSTVGIDKRQRIMGLKFIGEVGEALLKKVDPYIYNQLTAYCDGVNAFIDTHREWEELPIEFQLLRIKPEPFRISDLMSLNLFVGYMLSGNMEAELLRYGLIKKLGPDMAWKLAPLHYAPGPTIVPPELLLNKLREPRDLPPGGRPSDEELGDIPYALEADAAFDLLLADASFKKALYVKYPYASNNWVVGPKLTESGGAFVANDPHLTHVEPSLVYLMHLKGAGFDCYGATFPGNPYPVLGHTRKLGWGETTTAADVMDLFIETVDKARPGMYKYKGEWRPFTVREEIIRIKTPTGYRKKKIKIRQSIHGPIINEIADLPEDTPPVALRWVAWDLNRDLSQFELLITSATVEEFLSKLTEEDIKKAELMSAAHMFNILMKGDSIDDFIAGLDKLVLPNQSWVAADADGHIIYLPGGLVPVRKKGIGVMPVPGESGEYDWTGFIPLMELPYAIDPERGYMATANNEVMDSEWYPYIFTTNFGGGWRAWRIEELIKELAPLSMEDMKRIQNDVQIKEAAWYAPKIQAAVERKKPDDPYVLKAAEELRAWDFEADLEATQPVIFYTFKKELSRNIMEDEFSKKDLKAFSLGRGSVVTMWVDKGESEFFDDKRTRDVVEDLDDMLVKSLGGAMRKVEKEYGKDPSNREWGKLHVIKWFHVLGFGPFKELSVGPYPHLGGNGTVRNAGSIGIGRKPWKAVGGPVLRHVMDMSDPDNAQMVIDGSQSGQWLSPHYDDMHPLFVSGEYVRAEKRPERVKEEARYHLVLVP
jgi:penicillin amidase